MGYNLPLYNNLKMKEMALERLDALGYKWASGSKLNFMGFFVHNYSQVFRYM